MTVPTDRVLFLTLLENSPVFLFFFFKKKKIGCLIETGWRLDYFLASESIADQVHDSYIVPDIHGSDHCPIGLVLNL